MGPEPAREEVNNQVVYLKDREVEMSTALECFLLTKTKQKEKKGKKKLSKQHFTNQKKNNNNNN